MRLEFRRCRRFIPKARTGRRSGGASWVEYRVWGWGVDRGWITARGAARRAGIEHGEYPGERGSNWRRRPSGG
jgi:hypothetical protein